MCITKYRPGSYYPAMLTTVRSRALRLLQIPLHVCHCITALRSLYLLYEASCVALVVKMPLCLLTTVPYVLRL